MTVTPEAMAGWPATSVLVPLGGARTGAGTPGLRVQSSSAARTRLCRNNAGAACRGRRAVAHVGRAGRAGNRHFPKQARIPRQQDQGCSLPPCPQALSWGEHK